MHILVIDNYDSFTYNLVHYLEKYEGIKTSVFLNDKLTLEQAAEFDAILISPGPGLPEHAGITLPLLQKYAPTKKILGVCLGLQAMGICFGAKLKNLKQVQHGIAQPTVIVKPDLLFANIPNEFECGRYHSWVVDEDDFPDSLEITAIDKENNIMAAKHKQFNLRGVQFHPESVLTPYGEQLVYNWLFHC
ncbi:MAG: aminodeoxychorismate/anthranilate synthase component II [Bacteroidetes bacterium]|nr:aminodeoxychorismate/anthranilate synthase component II [Bacteroidota bacterium]